mgnify:CR=1 FL=1
MIREITDSPRLSTLIQHQFGNFVVQKTLRLARGQEKQDFIAAIERSFPQISDKKIRVTWQEIIENSTEEGSNKRHSSNEDYQLQP